MDGLFILFISAIAMALFSIPVMAICAILEAEHKKREIRRYVRRQIMEQMEREKKLEGQAPQPFDEF
jgi:hypothetical protein